VTIIFQHMRVTCFRQASDGHCLRLKTCESAFILAHGRQIHAFLLPQTSVPYFEAFRELPCTFPPYFCTASCTCHCINIVALLTLSLSQHLRTDCTLHCSDFRLFHTSPLSLLTYQSHDLDSTLLQSTKAGLVFPVHYSISTPDLHSQPHTP